MDKSQMDGHILQWVSVDRSVQHCNYKFGLEEKVRERGRGETVAFVMSTNEELSLIEW